MIILCIAFVFECLAVAMVAAVLQHLDSPWWGYAVCFFAATIMNVARTAFNNKLKEMP